MPSISFQAAGKGQPVIFIHGFCETGAIWKSFSDELSNDCQVITIDLPGFGESPLTQTDITIDGIGRELNEWVLAQGIKKPIVIGHSLGGYIALSMVDQKPSCFAAFGLVHSTARADTEEKKANRSKTIAFVQKHGLKVFVDSFVPGLYHQKNHPSLTFVYNIALQTRESTFLAYTAAMRDRPNREHIMANFPKPILLIAGEHDPIIPLSSLSEQALLSDLISFHSLPQVGHMGMFEATSLLLAKVRRFLSLVRNGQKE